jgi:6-phosphofructokinase 1
MGHTSGDIALYTGIGGGAEDILIPEAPIEIKTLAEKLKVQYEAGKKSSIIVVAEGETAGGVLEIKTAIEKVINWDIKISVLGHVQRGGDPSAFDRVLASRLGYESVLAVMNNENDKMVGMVKNTPTLTPLVDTWLKKKNMDMTYLKMNEVLASQQEKAVEIIT